MIIYEGKNGVFKNVDDAIKFIESRNFKGVVCVYDVDTDTAHKKVLELYEFIKEYNKGKPLNEQILPSNSYEYRATVGTVDVQVFSISVGAYHRTHDCITYIKGCNRKVLDE